MGLVGGGGSGYEGVDKIDYRGVQEIQKSEKNRGILIKSKK